MSQVRRYAFLAVAVDDGTGEDLLAPEDGIALGHDFVFECTNFMYSPATGELPQATTSTARSPSNVRAPKPLDPRLRKPAPPDWFHFVRIGNLLMVSGQICLDDEGKLVAKGQLGGDVSIEDGQKAARACAVNLLAQIKVAVGDLDKVVRVVRLGGFVNSVTDTPTARR